MANEYFYTDDPDVMILEIRNTKNEGDVFISSSDFELLSKHSWYIKDSSNTNPKGYVAAKINSKTIKLHRFLSNVADRKIIVDHFDRDPWNNRRGNLRNTTSSQNNLNISLSKNNKSGKTGLIYMQPSGRSGAKWSMQIRVNGKKHSRYFAVSIYGEAEAKRLAEKSLEELREIHGVFSE